MHSTPTVALVAALLGLCGCSTAAESGQAAPAVTTTAPQIAAPAPAPGAPPAAEALTDVMYRLADPSVPGAGKLGLVAGSSAPDASVLDRFAAALRDGGFTPVTFTATDIRWSQNRPADAVATITATTTNPVDPGEFSFPMEFTPAPGGGWQLTRATAEMVLAYGDTPRPARPTG